MRGNGAPQIATYPVMEDEMIVADVMSKVVVSVMPGHSIWHAAKIMLAHKVSGLPVIDGDGHLAGVLTEGDLMRRVEFGLGEPSRWTQTNSPEGAARDFVRARSWRVSDVMSAPAVVIEEKASLTDAADLLSTRNIKRLPVVRGGVVVGVISRADLLRVIASGAPDQIADGDDALWMSAETRLREASNLFAELPEVTVIDGIVHLWGTVRSEAERDAARVAVEGIEGVNGVQDHLTVRQTAA